MIIAVNFPILAIGKKKPEKIRASMGFEPVTSALPERCSKINCYMGQYSFKYVSGP